MKRGIIIISIAVAAILTANIFSGKKGPSLKTNNISQIQPLEEASNILPAEKIISMGNTTVLSGTTHLKAKGNTEGTIGVLDNSLYDNPRDNVFEFQIDQDIQDNQQVYLEYDLYGLKDFTSVCKGVNDNLATGGLMVSISNQWSHQKELIGGWELKKGSNKIRFSKPADYEYGYKIKNVSLHILPAQSNERQLVINQPEINTYFKKYGYLQGYVSGKGAEKAKVYIDGKPVRQWKQLFEGLAVKKADSVEKDWQVMVSAVFEDGEVLSAPMNYMQSGTVNYMPVYEQGVNYTEQVLSETQDMNISLSGITLEGKAGCVSQPCVINITGLRAQDMPMPSSDMINVTAGNKGYRCLPHGSNFKDDITIKIKYDSTLIPAGYGIKDIRTFYYDEEQADWVMLPYDTVLIATNEVVSRTNHFTDFVNAILKTPESPTTQAFTPTSMKDVKLADPLAGYNVMEAPSANNNGSLNLNFPLQLPAGRQGMQPQIAISYSSSSGNGWLGVGWNINLPAITVETRWGVPKYMGDKESESYLLNGEELLPMVQKAKFVARITGDKIFKPKVEGAFDKIIRHGNNPKDYWWEVIDKNGIRYLYGKYESDNGVNSNCVLTDGNGNIARWALAETRDLYTNFVKYTYALTSKTLAPLTYGKQLYIQDIQYTGFGSTNGKYKVEFIMDNQSRGDYFMSARQGFIELTDKLLKQVNITYDGNLIRSYILKYKDGAYNKKLLCFIADLTNPNDISFISNPSTTCETSLEELTEDARCHRFNYFTNTDQTFSAEHVVSTNYDDGENSFPEGILSDLEEASLGKTTTEGWGAGGSLDLGLGFNVCSKSVSLGGNMNYSENKSKTRLVFTDINGDGLPDRIYKKNGVIQYRKLCFNNNQLQYSNTESIIPGLPTLGKSFSSSLGWGLEGQIVVATGSYNHTRTDNIVKEYFSDVNGDGFIDFIDEDKVFYNYPSNLGDPIFVQETSDEMQYPLNNPCNFIIRSGSVNDSVYTPYIEYDTIINGEDTIIINLSQFYSYNRDGVRMWIAPYNGTVTIENKVQLIEDTSYSRKQSYKVDGVKYSIQKGGTIVYKDRIKANDYSVHLSDTSIQVLKDDIIYFRLESMLDRSYDNVHWNPSIIYSAIDNNNNIDTNDVDAEGKKIAVFRPSDDLLIGNNQKFIAPFSGNIRIKGDITVDHVSDELFFKLKYGRMATWLQHNFNMDTLQTYHIDNTFYVSKDSTIDFSAFTYTNIDFNKVHYDLSMIYLNRDGNSLDTTKTSERIIIRPVMSFNIYENTKQKSVPYQFSGGNYLIEPQASIPFYDPLGSNCSIEFAVKSNNKTLAKWEIPISFGNLVNPSRYVNIPTGSDVYFEAYAKSGTLYEISSMSVKVNNGTTPYNVGLYDKFGQIMMKYGNLYKGWGQFSYYEDGDTIQTLPINYSLVTAFENDTNLINSLSTSSIIDETSAQNSLSLGGVNDPSHNPFNTMTPDMGLDVYVDYCRFAYIGKDKMSNMVLRESVSGFLNDTVYDSPLIISSDPNAPIMTIGKSTVDISNSYSIASGMSDKLSYSHNKTKSQVVTDYMDINGDKYPDIIGTLFVQYSTPQGGLFDNVVQNLNVNEFQKTNNMSQGTAAGVDMPTSGHPFFPLKGTGNPQTTISESHYSSSGSFELSGYSGESVSDFDLIDVNGDGLPDKVLNDVEGHVALNLGYTFSGPIPWGFVSKNKSYNASGSLSGVSSFSYGQYSWSGGFELSYSDNHSDQVAVDLNGDGLMDYIERNNSNLIAYINSGNSVGSPNIFTHPQNSDELHIHKSYSISGSGDLAASAGIPIVFIKIVINGHGFMSFSGNFEKLLLVDFNNDGYPDIVEANPGSDNSITVRYNNLAKINLLKEVITPTSAKYLFNYDLTQCDQKMPQRQMVLSSLKVYDGYAGDGQDTVYQSFSYANGYYDRYDRDFYGFETVTTEQYDPVSLASGGIYRSTVEKYHNQDYLFKGIKYYEALMKGIDHKIVETYYKFDRKEISSGKVIPADSAQCYGPYYPAISQEDRFFYAENTNTPIHTQKKYKHGKFGNIEKYTNRGDVADPTDDLFATISYDYDTVQYHLLSMVNTIVVRDTNNQDLRSRKAYYYDGKGRPNRISEYSSSGSVDITYDTYGNIKRIAYPPNNNNQRMTYKYMYDNQVHTYPILIVDTLGFENHTFYDYRLGVPLSVVDITGNAIQYEYYNDGRLKSITSPKELAASGAPYTMRFEYHHGPEDKKIFSATTSVLDATQLPNIFYFGTVLYSDGLGRNIRTVKNIVENGTDKFLISGKQEFDGYGRVVKAHLPISDYSYPSLTAFDINFTNPYSAATYDEQDRPITQTTPDLKTTSYEYGFGTDALGSLRFKTKVTDANGNYAINYTNPMGKTTSTDNALQLITKFAYNPMGELMESTDPEDNTTIYTYDLLGRMISCIHPDAGTTSYEYDLAGNLLTLQTENLAQSHSEIRYDYDFNRLISTTYPNNPENNVEYEYGDVNSGNNVGRLVKMQDASGVQEFNYGNMGEMIENTHTYLVPGGDPITFKMAWEYDSWNRLLNITYPDGEMVNYHYNNAGSLTSMDGVKGSDSYYYIWDIQYDLYGKRNKIFYGNGALSEYTYDPINQTLTNLKTYDGSYNLLQDINYTYDNTNNISSIENIASNSFVDSYQYNYTYDEIYRLTNATGNYTINHIAYPFSLGMEYSASGNILNKTQSYTKTTNGSMSAISYDNDYFYNDRPHTVTEAGNMLYSWDLNGNMVYREDQNTQAGRYLCWDEENRLMSARDFDTENAYTSSYIYDAGGERVWKLAGQDQIMYINGNVAVSFLAYNKTLYTNPYMVLTESEYTKHYYIEGERVCSKIGSGFGTAPFMPNTSSLTPIEGTVESISADLSNYVNKTVECVGSTSTVEIGPTFDYLENGGNQPEQNQYFYHSDHLGSSSYITDISGSAVQHLQYMPFGETMVDERTYSTFNSRYTFSGKEKDDETQYSYFGARYYDSDLSVWLSVDPLADKYPTMSPFMYCAGNPVVLVDPDGLSSIIPPTKGMYDKNEISPEAQQRFEAILHNLPTFLENKDFVNAFTQTTGLSEAELQTFLTYNTGPTLTIGPGTDCHANNKDNFTFGADIINYLGSLTENDCNEIYEQSFGMGLVLIDELTHCGDMKFNNNKTGTGVTGTPPGEQNWHYSPNNHRGGDPKIFGFGVTTSTMVDDGTTRLGVKRHRGEVVIHPYNYSSDLQGNKRPPILPNIPLYTNSELLQFGSKLLGE